MSEEKIENLEELLHPFLPGDDPITSHKTTLLQSEENHNARITAVEVCVNGCYIQLVAKTPSKEKADFHKEIIFYSTIVPTLNHFQKKETLDELNFISVFYGGRLNLNYSESIDSNAVLLLENLQVPGYKNRTSFDLGTTRQVLKDLASFHAIPLALKLKDPKVFDTKIKRFLGKRLRVQYPQATIDKMLDLVPEIRDKFEETPRDTLVPVRAPFSTMIHCDCCFRNIMVKSTNGLADIKLIDFQKCSFGSLAEDLIFFLYTSVELEVLEEHSDGLIEFYHSNFLRVLEECRCDPTPFSIDALLKEMKIVAQESQLAHIIYRLCSEESVNSDLVLFVMKDFMSRDWV